MPDEEVCCPLQLLLVPSFLYGLIFVEEKIGPMNYLYLILLYLSIIVDYGKEYQLSIQAFPWRRTKPGLDCRGGNSLRAKIARKNLHNNFINISNYYRMQIRLWWIRIYFVLFQSVFEITRKNK